MTDHEAETRMVAEALGATFGVDEVRKRIIFFPADHDFATQTLEAEGWFLPALIALARRLRETEQQRDELRDVVRGLEQALFLATSGRETGPSGCVVVEPVALPVQQAPAQGWWQQLDVAQDDFGRRRRDVG